MNCFLLILFSAILFTNAVELKVTDEDVNSLLYSLLSACQSTATGGKEKLRSILLILTLVLMIRKLKIAHSKWLLISDGETLLVHMELILFTKELLQEAILL